MHEFVLQWRRWSSWEKGLFYPPHHLHHGRVAESQGSKRNLWSTVVRMSPMVSSAEHGEDNGWIYISGINIQSLHNIVKLKQIRGEQ